MNKLEKILAQSVTPEMVAEQLTEQENEEVIEEYEAKIANAEDDIELAKEREQAMRKCAEQSLKRAEDWKRVVESEVEKAEAWRSVVNKAKQALKEKIYSPNEQRAKLIEESKKYVERFEGILQVTVSEGERTVSVLDLDYEEGFVYPKQLVWNEHIVKAYGVAKYTAYEELAHKFGVGAPQPNEIVEGMDVMLYNNYGTAKKFFARGEVSFFDSSLDKIIFSVVNETRSGVYPKENTPIYRVSEDGFKILGDTKAKYEEEKNE